jgi:hypothetical protein
MSFRRLASLLAVAVATLLWIACGQVYRPVVIPISISPPNTSGFHEVFTLSTNTNFNPGAALQIDVAGDSEIGQANVGLSPTHLGLLPNNSRVFVASGAGNLCPPETDVITAFSPATDTTTATGISSQVTFSLPNSGPSQIANITSISEAGNIVTATVSGTLTSPTTSGGGSYSILVANVGISGYNGCFVIQTATPTSTGTIVTYVDPVTGLAATSGGTVTVPTFCPYLPDYVTTASNSSMYEANFGVENNPNCNLASTDSVALLSPTNNSISNIQYFPGTHPVAMVETPDTINLYVLNQGTNNITDLSPVDLSTLATIPLPSGASVPAWAVARVDAKRVYVLTEGTGQILPIDTASNSILPSQTNLTVGAGANFMLYDSNLNRLYVPFPGTLANNFKDSAVYVYSTTGGVDLSGNANDTPSLLGVISMSSGTNAPCPNGCSAESVAALADGSRFYVASIASASSCPDPNVGTLTPCLIPRLTVYDAASMNVKPMPSSASLLPPSLSLLTNVSLTTPQFTATQYAVPPVSQCEPAPIYSPFSPRFRMFAAPSADSSHVYVSVCDAGVVADVETTTSSISTSGSNAPDTLKTDLMAPTGTCPGLSCGSVSSITSFSITSGVATFQGVNNFTAGTRILISGLSSAAGTPLDGQTLTVLATGLTETQFECAVSQPNVGSTTDSGTAALSPAAPITAFSIASNVVTFQAANTFVPGEQVAISGLTSTIGIQLDNLNLAVLTTGLTASQFQAALPSSIADTPLTSDTGTALATPVALITSFSITSNIITFQASNAFTPGTRVAISGLSSSAGTPLNGQTLAVLTTGISRSQFESSCLVATTGQNVCSSNPNVGATTDAGVAVPTSPPQNPTFLTTGQ